MAETVKILFLGDIVGKAGRRIVCDYLAESKNEENPDFIIANVENTSHGFGLTEKNYNELLSYGINAMTSGNHIWDKKEIFKYINRAEALIRPLNYPEGTPGMGSRVFDAGEYKIGVINLLGRTFMSPIDSPWKILENEVNKIKEITPIIIVDFHAEATAEKICLGYFCRDLGVSAVLGTHTHVQTADERILGNCCAYITDAGFCGDYNSVIGMEYKTSLNRLMTSLPARFDVADTKESQLNGVYITVDTLTGCAVSIKRVNCIKKYDEVNSMMKG